MVDMPPLPLHDFGKNWFVRVASKGAAQHGGPYQIGPTVHTKKNYLVGSVSLFFTTNIRSYLLWFFTTNIGSCLLCPPPVIADGSTTPPRHLLSSLHSNVASMRRSFATPEHASLHTGVKDRSPDKLPDADWYYYGGPQ